MKKGGKTGRRLAAVLLAVLLALSALTGCSGGAGASSGSSAEKESEADSVSASETQADSEAQEAEDAAGDSTVQPVDVRIAALKGPTAMGMVKFMDDVDQQVVTDENYTFSIVASPDEVTPQIVQGSLDIAAVPANLASILYNNTDGAVQVLTVNTLGVLYIVENGDTVHSVSDLAGKTIYASGKGSTPEYALNYVLEQNGLVPGTDVTIGWKSEHSECVAAITADATGIAMLPQPFVTTAQAQNESLRVALDLTEEWEKVQGDDAGAGTMITGATIARTEFVQEHPEAVENFLKHYQESVEYVNANTEEAAKLVGAYDIVTEEVAKTALPECNIVYLAGDEMKEKLSGYLSVLNEQNPESIGGTLPGDDFYYTQETE